MKTKWILVLFFVTLAGANVAAQTWNGSISNNWNNAANWTPAGVPGAGAAVTINNGALVNQPALQGDVNIASITMSQGILNLNGFTLTCSGAAAFTGDSLLNGKIVAAGFSNVQDMRMGGKITFDKTGAVNNFWGGNNKVHHDSLVVIWRSGALHLQTAAADSIFAHCRIQAANSSTISFSENFPLYVENNLIIDNPGNGTFSWNSATNNVIGGNLVAIHFSNTNTNLLLKNITTLGNNENGPFKCYSGSITNCNFNGNFTLTGDSSAGYIISNSSFHGANNLFQALGFNAHDNVFGQSGMGTTILRSTNNTGSHVYTRFGNNKFLGNVQLETYAVMPAGVTIQQTYYGPDSCQGNLVYLLKGNAALTTNSNGNSYVAGNVVIDGQGARKWVEFTGSSSATFTIGGDFTVKNFTPFSEPGVGNTNVHLRNVQVTGTDTCGTFYCYSGDITNSSFKGNFKLVADSAAGFDINNASFLGADNLFQALAFTARNSSFGKTGTGTTILRSANNAGAHVFTRFGNNKIYGNAQLETYAVMPAGVTIQQTYFGPDSCWGNLVYLLKGNAALTTNTNGNSYVAGNVVIDGQGARKWVEFTGSSSATFTIGGNFTVKNFTPVSEPGVGNTGVYLRNVTAAGTDTCGTFYCYNGDIANSIFNGNMNLIADSSQTYILNNASFLGANNLFQSGTLDVRASSFGQPAAGKTILRAAHNVASVVFFREGNNKFLGDIQLEANATLPGGTTIQQTFYGKDTCFGNLIINLSGSSNIYLANSENLYIGKGLFLNNNSTTSGVIHYYGVTAIYFIGTDTADYSYSGSGIAPAILNIVMNKRGALRLQSPLTYTGNLTLARGVILSSALNPLTIPYGAATSVAWDSSYVDGPVIRTGNTAFTFPLGQNNVYAPISIMPPTLITDAFKAQYLNSNPHLAGFDSLKHDLTLNHISPGEYWLLDRTNGTATPKVLLSWKAKRSGVVNVMNDLRVARWNGTTWKDEGNGITTGNNEEGTIQSFNDFSDFSPFTLASSSINNPLPVSFVLFNAILRADRTVLLQWQTEQEINNAWFEVQKSTDGINWVTLSIMFPKPLREYEAIDNAAAFGMNYYRVKQVDINGKYIYTIIKTIKVSRDNKIFLWPNPVSDNLNIQAPFAKGTIEIVDASGRVVLKDMIINAITTIPVKQLARGSYLIRIRYEGEVYIEKFIKE